MILHGGVASPFFRKTRVALEEKGIKYETRELSPIPKTPELLALNPLGKIPVVQDGDRTIPDSSVICAYLEKVHPEPALYPDDAGELAHALFLEEYADTKMVEVLGGILFERFIKPNFFQQEPDTERVDDILQNQLPPVLAYLETQLEQGATSLCSRFGIADIAVGAQLQNLAITETAIDTRATPKLAAYMDAILGRPSFKAAAR